ncbi:putative quinol monooxygenase [Quadrisphaera sp. KR29]|uniref:putative quinol monooxygenase n=1 Tax=Quadrisphaera sp. KR29 TaxID=3461391 RepID=UPI0040449A7D
MDEPGAVDLIATIAVPPAQLTRVLRMLQEYGESVRAEPGNQRFEVYASDAEDHSVVVLERYASASAFQAHLDHPANARFNEALGAVLGGAGSRLELLRAPSPTR